MISGLASNTFSPAHGPTWSVNRPRPSTGTTCPMGMPAASQVVWSSSPKPGAMWTTPVPSEAPTKSAPRIRKASVLSAKKSNIGVKERPTRSLPRSVPTSVVPSSWAA